MLDKVIEMWQPRSILDVGCGTGKAIDYFISRGLSDVVGVEGSQIAIDSATNPEVLKCCDLVNTVDLGRTFDLVYSFEVAEHLPPHAANAFIGTLVNHGDRVLMTAARPGQGGMGHLNEQEPIYWIEKLDHVGFDYDERAAEELKGVRDLHYSNIMVFVRRTTPELN
jgi:SAM-dependent methyltransferase